MNKKVADLPQSMKDMAQHGEWKRMMEVKEKISRGFNGPFQGRKGLRIVNSPRRDHRVTFTVVILFLLEPSNMLCGIIMPRY